MASSRSLTSKVVYTLAFAIIVYVILGLHAGWPQLRVAATQFNWWWFVPVILLSVLNTLVRFLKWQYYLRVLELKVPVGESFLIYLSGSALSITPGKLGEAIKSYFLKVRYEYPVARTVPIVLADRLSDVMALVILAAVGALGIHHGQAIIWGVAIAILLLLAMVTIRPIGERMVRLLSRLPLIGRHAPALMELYESAYVLLWPSRLVGPTLYALLAWGSEAFGFFLIFRGFGITAGLLAAVFIYSFSTLLGEVAMLPGGLGVTEGAITGLLLVLSVSEGSAALATILIRVATLWCSVLAGAIALIITEHRFGVKANNLLE